MEHEASTSKIDEDQLIDEYADAIGVPPGIVIPDDEVAEIREEREAQARLQALQAAAAPAKDAASAAKSLSEARPDDGNALGTVSDALSQGTGQ